MICRRARKSPAFGWQLDQKNACTPDEEYAGDRDQKAEGIQAGSNLCVHPSPLRLLLRRCNQSRARFAFGHPAFHVDNEHADEEQEDHGEADGADELL